jgi:hypothetical protein
MDDAVEYGGGGASYVEGAAEEAAAAAFPEPKGAGGGGGAFLDRVDVDVDAVDGERPTGGVPDSRC